MLGWEYTVNFILYLQCLILARFASGNSCSAHLTKCSVATSSGRIIGDCSDKDVFKYFSIPYAQSPTGDKRLENPIAFSQPSTNLVQGTSLPPKCPQLGSQDESEDCLYLNIWAPNKIAIGRPVLFWIHGGSNWLGSGSDPIFDGSKFAKSQDVIIITFNYRLGVLGFFDDGNDTNFAVKDTVIALKWVRDNIGNFGGNKNKVTVFGNSSGGSIIRALMSTHEAENLFQGVIIQSDPEAYGFNKREVSEGIITQRFYSNIGCTNKNCVKSKSIEQIVQAQYQTITWALTSSNDLRINTAYPFGPNIDNSFISKDFSEYLSTNSLPFLVDMIIGFTKNEAGPTINSLFTSPYPAAYFGPTLSGLLGANRSNYLLASNVYQLNDDTDTLRTALTKFGTDYYWGCPIQYNSRTIARNGQSKVFLYELEKGIQYPTNNVYSLCSNGAVCHQDDILLTFGNYDSNTAAELKSLSNSIQTAWARFAKYGSPNSCGNIYWPEASSESNLQICHLGENYITSEVNSLQCDILDVIQYPFQLFSS